MKNIEILEFKQAIQNFVRKSTLPEELKRMILEGILEEQAKISMEAMKREIEERDKEEAEHADAESLQ